MFGALKRGRFRSLASLILVVNVVGKLQHVRHRAVSLRQHVFLVLKICSIVCQKLQGPRDLGHTHFQGNYLCARWAFPIQSCKPNLKSLAQVVFEILRSKRNGVTSLTFQGHVTSSVT